MLLAATLLAPTAAGAAPVTVTTMADSGPGSLRSAIAAASSGDAISFASGLSGTVTLTSGPLVIDKTLAIDGPGVSLLTISGNHASRVFFINPGAPGALTGPPATTPTVSIARLRIADGLAQGAAAGAGDIAGGAGGSAGMGGGIFINRAAVTLTGVAVSGNAATGGGIPAASELLRRGRRRRLRRRRRPGRLRGRARWGRRPARWQRGNGRLGRHAHEHRRRLGRSGR